MNALVATPKQNRILAKLPAPEYLRIESELEAVALRPGQVIYEAGRPVDFLYFLASGIVSLIWTSDDGATSELAITGNDGVIGVPAVLGSHNTTHRTLVQSAGAAFRVRAEVASWLLEHGGTLPRLMSLYAQTLINQIAQIALCSRHHSVEQQLCRWILLHIDHLPGVQLDATQALIAERLAIRRAAVSEAAGALQAAGLMSYRRGQITVLDRAALQGRACSCYSAIKAESERLLESLPNCGDPPQKLPEEKNLRARAERRLKLRPARLPSARGDLERLVRDLQLRQIELELQNEELAGAYADADAARARAADIYDFAPVAYLTVDALGAIQQINLSGAILLGIKRSQIRLHRLGASVAPTFLPAFERFLADVLGGQTRKTCEIELSPTPHRGTAIVRIEAIASEDGLECRMVVIDVTEQRRVEKALRTREQYQRALLDNFPFMVWLKDEESRFLAVNRPFAARFGWPSAESLVGKSDFDITTPDLAEVYRADDRAILDSGESRIVEEWIEDHGRREWSETYKSPVTLDGQVIGTVGFAREITERKRIEASLLEQKEFFHLIAENIGDFIAVLDRDGRRIYNSPSYSRFLGMERDLQGTDSFADVHPDDRERVMQAFRQTVRTGIGSHLEYRMCLPDGSCRNLESTGSAIRDESGKVFRVVVVSHDVTERRTAEQQMQHFAFYDSLTGLPNRRLLIDRLAQSMVLSARSDCYGAAMFLDLDKFKPLNDTYGHSTGDALLVQAANRMKACVREVDTVSRFGGDEFVIVISELDPDREAAKTQAMQVAEKLRASLSDPYRLTIRHHGRDAEVIEYPCTATIGVVLFLDHDVSQDDILERADEAMYRARKAGRNRIHFAG